jgi:hypothetical protein
MRIEYENAFYHVIARRSSGDGACKYVFSIIERNGKVEILRDCYLPKIVSGFVKRLEA